jgi:hypothetical protein
VRNAITDGINKANLELPLMPKETSEEDEELAEEEDADEEKDVPEEKDVEVDEEASVISTANPAMTKLE